MHNVIRKKRRKLFQLEVLFWFFCGRCDVANRPSQEAISGRKLLRRICLNVKVENSEIPPFPSDKLFRSKTHLLCCRLVLENRCSALKPPSCYDQRTRLQYMELYRASVSLLYKVHRYEERIAGEGGERTESLALWRSGGARRRRRARKRWRQTPIVSFVVEEEKGGHFFIPPLSVLPASRKLSSPCSLSSYGTSSLLLLTPQ